MNKELQIDDLTRGINDDEPMFNETERREQEAPASEVREQGTALPSDKCWQDFMSYLEVPADGDGKVGRLVCKLDRDLADSLDDCDIRGRCRSDLVNAIVRSFFENHSTGQKPCSPGLPSFTPWRPPHIPPVCCKSA